MKGLCKLVGLILALSLLLVGCGGAKVDVVKLADDLSGKLTFQDELSPIDETALYAIYDIDPSKVKAQRVYVSSGATAEEIAAFEAADAAAAKDIHAAVLQRIADQKDGFANYNPGEMVKLEHPTVVTKGNYVVLCLSDDPAMALSEIQSLLK